MNNIVDYENNDKKIIIQIILINCKNIDQRIITRQVLATSQAFL